MEDETTYQETFIGNVFESGDSLVITIPAPLVKYSGLAKGDCIKVMYKKLPKTKEEQ